MSRKAGVWSANINRTSDKTCAANTEHSAASSRYQCLIKRVHLLTVLLEVLVVFSWNFYISNVLFHMVSCRKSDGL